VYAQLRLIMVIYIYKENVTRADYFLIKFVNYTSTLGDFTGPQ